MPAEIPLGKEGPVELGSPMLGAALLGSCLCPTPLWWGKGRGRLGLLAAQVVLACCHLASALSFLATAV